MIVASTFLLIFHGNMTIVQMQFYRAHAHEQLWYSTRMDYNNIFWGYEVSKLGKSTIVTEFFRIFALGARSSDGGLPQMPSRSVCNAGGVGPERDRHPLGLVPPVHDWGG
jgi:hypothetical protein